MNEHQLSQLDFTRAIEQFGDGINDCSHQAVVLLDEASTSFKANDTAPVTMRKSIIACRVVERDSDKQRIKVKKVWRYFEDGTGCPEDGEQWIGCAYLRKPILQRLQESDELFQ